MLSGLNFVFPMLFITVGTLTVGAITVLSGWVRITDQWHSTGQRLFPKALCALTASVFIDLVGFIIFAVILGWMQMGNLVTAEFGWFISSSVGLLLGLAALFMSRSRNVARSAVLAGSSAVVAVNVTGFIWLFVATNGSPISYWACCTRPCN